METESKLTKAQQRTGIIGGLALLALYLIVGYLEVMPA